MSNEVNAKNEKEEARADRAEAKKEAPRPEPTINWEAIAHKREQELARALKVIDEIKAALLSLATDLNAGHSRVMLAGKALDLRKNVEQKVRDIPSK